MALKELFKRGIGKLLKNKKTDPVSGESQKLITYTPEAKKQTAKQLAKQDATVPVKVDRKITDDLLMGENTQPAFGSATYDWAMRKGPGKYSADEWIDHLTSSRKVNYKIFGKPSSRIERGPKTFTYDKGSRFAGKQATIGKEELFDSNLAEFDQLGNITGGLLGAAKKFGIKLSAQDVGNMIKMNPVNRLKPVEFGMVSESPKLKYLMNSVESALTKVIGQRQDDIRASLAGLQRAIASGDTGSAIANHQAFINATQKIKSAAPKNSPLFKEMNRIQGLASEALAIARGRGGMRPVKYQNETNYTFPGGQNYRETVFVLDEPIPGNTQPMKNLGHYGDLKNNLFHVRYDTRSLPNGKKALVIHEIQSDANQTIAKELSKAQAFGGVARSNPFQKDIELNLLINSRTGLLNQMDDAIAKNQFKKARIIDDELKTINRKINNTFGKGIPDDVARFDYYPMIEADAYGDYALKFLMNKAAKENIDYVAVMPFNKLHFRQGYKAGNERFYGYPSGRGIGDKGQAILPQLMKKSAKFYDTKAGTIKLSLSDPKKPYKEIDFDKFKYPADVKGGRTESSIYHKFAHDVQHSGTRFTPESDPTLYFNAFGIEVTPAMKYTQKLYKKEGGLVVDMFKTL